MNALHFVVKPVTSSRWPDMARLFEARGAPHYCWCMVYRSKRNPEMTKTQRKAAMRARVRRGTPVGMLAYETREPVGWCSVAPRETYPRLQKSRTMPRVDHEPTWTVLCFFVRRSHRGKGTVRALLDGALRYARSKGARVVEAYPYDTAGITSRHRGHSREFRAAGFRREGKRWAAHVE